MRQQQFSDWYGMVQTLVDQLRQCEPLVSENDKEFFEALEEADEMLSDSKGAKQLRAAPQMLEALKSAARHPYVSDSETCDRDLLAALRGAIRAAGSKP